MTDNADVLRPGHGIVVPVGVIEWRFTPSGGPGGQHANRSNTRVEAILDLTAAPGIPDDTRRKLIAKLGDTVSVVVDENRSQHRNRQLAVERVEQRLRTAMVTRKRRRPTRPSKGSVQRRLTAKRQRSETKRTRSRVRPDEH